MPLLRIEIKRGRDGPATLSCVRPDGSRTWHHVHPFFPGHDLLHFALETTLGFAHAFYGLIAQGWDLSTFEDREARARMGAEAIWAEGMVGLFDQERGGGRRWSAGEFNDAIRLECEMAGLPPCRPVTDAELDAVRARHRELLNQWSDTPPGGVLALEFQPAGVTA
jgi:hypothetical protein